MKLTISAYAKINLGLRVLSQRPDGYHDLITIMQRISLHDTIQLTPSDGLISYQGPTLTSDPEQNLCVKAARIFQQHVGSHCGVDLSLVKEIPIGSGLGGGSSDAAAVLTGLGQIYSEELNRVDPEQLSISTEINKFLQELNLDPSQRRKLLVLLSLGALLGADVPFFVSQLPAALAQGRGEVLSLCPPLRDDYLIIVIYPNFESSTQKAYKDLHNFLTFSRRDVKLLTCEFLELMGSIPDPKMGNDFELSVFHNNPDLAQARDLCYNSGAAYAGLSGSGSAIYGIFDHNLRHQASQLRFPEQWRVLHCHSVLTN